MYTHNVKQFKSKTKENFEKSINMIVRNALEKLKEPGAIPSIIIKEAILEGIKLKNNNK